ncbi:unnamed protein product [Rhodiola kirilowii]
MIDATTGHEALSFMDCTAGYNQIHMAPEDQDATAFRTSKGIFCYKVMPFGLKNAGATYQRAMQKIFEDMMHKTIECYVDDVVVKSKTRSDHVQDLRTVFERLRKCQLKMNPLKCAFGVTSGKFLGFVVTHRGIEIDQTKIKAIQEMPEPKSLKELRGLQAQQSLQCYQARLSRAFNKKVRPRSFQKEDLVLAVRRSIITSHKTGSKFKAKWDGPYVVQEAYTNGAYKIVDQEGLRVGPIN